MPGREIVLTEEFSRALALLRERRHLFVTGKAGTGKSTLIRQFMADSERKAVVVAPTGVAALNVNGYTIHRLFGFTAWMTVEDVRSGRYRPTRFAETLASLDTLIIDEASMVRADLFDKLAAALSRFGPEPGTPFGGVQIVLVGDLYQLPPVMQEAEAEFFATRYATPYFFSADSFRREDFPTVALTTVFRQSGDDGMTSILNEIREGILLGHAQRQLNARTDPFFVPRDDEFWLTLAPTNRLVTARNRENLDQLPGAEVHHRATLTGDLSLFDPPVDDELRFKVGAQIMMVNNDESDRWVNGTMGRIRDVIDGEKLLVTVEFNDGSVADVVPQTWEATRPVIAGGALRHQVVGSFTQLPFKLAWAITIHKSQGQTLDRVVVDLTGGTFSSGQLYVALSRCTSMRGLVLKRPVLPKDLKSDRRIARFLNSSVRHGNKRRYCAVEVLTVGDEGRMSRPRPVELAVAFDDGTAVSTVINPQCDLADARQAFGISASDVLLAPTLAEAWSVIAPMLVGCTPVGFQIDTTMGIIDFELKRLGHVVVMPLGVEVPSAGLTPEQHRARSGRTALERARVALDALTASGYTDAGSTEFAQPRLAPPLSGHLVSRDHRARTPTSLQLPAVSALLQVSQHIGGTLLGSVDVEQVRAQAGAIVETSWLAAARHSVAEQLKAVAKRARLTDESIRRLESASALLGIEIIDSSVESEWAGPDISAVLNPGARVTFTGTAQDSAGRPVSKDELATIAKARGLVPVKTVSKWQCEALIAAEVGTQSIKARKAQEMGKPVFSADEFLAWARALRSVAQPTV
ncbi:AAA family ATPase [Mycolicibacterium komossense]|uniref:AAA family ATPase n=1 Tax=Mycolicibacterium komossense TaxID=1779 RepID=A0ABT3C9U0_9MYCO|nr:AAA family ATPase [Mycolicibacterium komossense]MCV7226239.1 AAA family ATPase [Mycolicibacterium komossense]